MNTPHLNKKNTFTMQINHYLENSNSEHLQKIENLIENFFNVDKAELWSYKDQMLTSLDNSSKHIPLGRSLTYEAIHTREIQIENHLKSAKIFDPDIDNPRKINARALLIYPIQKDAAVIGIIKLFMMIGSSRTFTKQQKFALEPFQNNFSHLFTQTLVNIDSTDITEENESSQERQEVLQIKEELKTLKEQYELLLKERQEDLQQYKKAVTHYKQRDKQHTETIEALQNELNTIKKEESENQTVIQSLRTKLQHDEQHYKRNLKKYKEILQRSEKKDISYQEKVTQLQLMIEQYKEQEKAFKQALEKKKKKEEKKTVKTPGSIERESTEMIIEATKPYINTQQHMRVFFDLALFSSSTQNSAAQMEKLLESTQLLKKLIEKPSFEHTIPVKKHKHSLEKTVKILESYQDTVFNGIFNIQIRKHKDLPSRLYYDAVKIEHTVMYLLIDLFEVTDSKQPVYIDIRYEKKILIFKIKAKTDSVRKTEQARFKKGGFFKSSHPGLSLLFAHKLATHLNGNIASSRHEKGYTHVFQISASDSAID